MVCAGTGLAPFRGFLQDRALRAQEEGTAPAPALLFFGCGGPDVDYLYREELAAWSEAGIVDVRPAFSMAPAVHDTCKRIYIEATGADPAGAEEWMTRMQRDHGRYLTDVFA